MKNGPMLTVLLCALALVLSGCDRGPSRDIQGSPGKSAAPAGSAMPASATKTLTIAGPKNVAMLPIIAADRNLFGQEHVAAKFEPLQTGKLAMDAVVAGDVEIGVVVDTNIAHVMFQPGIDLTIIASIMEKTDDALVVRADRGIRGPADLAGKSIAYLPGTTSDAFLWRFLAHNGVKAESVKLMSTTAPALQAAMIKGDVDAAAIWQPWRANIGKELGARGSELNNDGVYVCYAVLAVRRQLVEQRSDELRSILRALIRAEQVLVEQPEARATLATAIPIDRAILDASWKDYRPRVALAPGLLANLQSEGEHLRKTQPGFSGKAQPNYAQALDGQVLRIVAPERVTVEAAHP